MFAVRLSIQSACSRDSNILLLEGIDERRVVHKFNAFKPAEDDGEIFTRIGAELKSGPGFDAQVDVTLEMNGAR